MGGIALLGPGQNPCLSRGLDEACTFYPVKATFVMLKAHAGHQVGRHIEFWLLWHVVCQ